MKNIEIFRAEDPGAIKKEKNILPEESKKTLRIDVVRELNPNPNVEAADLSGKLGVNNKDFGSVVLAEQIKKAKAVVERFERGDKIISAEEFLEANELLELDSGNRIISTGKDGYIKAIAKKNMWQGLKKRLRFLK